MKYSQYSSNNQGNSAFYIVIAFCLILIGVAAWFAFSRMNAEPPVNQTPQSSIDNNFSEYPNDTSSYNEIVPDTSSDIISSEITNEIVENEPYTEPQAYALPVNGEILKDFSNSALQYSATFGDMRIHNAVDIACSEGTVVTACTDGKVMSIEETSSLGTVITIDHGDGLIIKYAAIKDVAVKKDASVSMGDKLGTVGTVPNECADQTHLHLEAYSNGESISILELIK